MTDDTTHFADDATLAPKKAWLEIGEGGTKEEWREAYEQTHKWLMHTRAKLRAAEDEAMELRGELNAALSRNADHPSREALANARQKLLRFFRCTRRPENVPQHRTMLDV